MHTRFVHFDLSKHSIETLIVVGEDESVSWLTGSTRRVTERVNVGSVFKINKRRTVNMSRTLAPPREEEKKGKPLPEFGYEPRQETSIDVFMIASAQKVEVVVAGAITLAAADARGSLKASRRFTLSFWLFPPRIVSSLSLFFLLSLSPSSKDDFPEAATLLSSRHRGSARSREREREIL